ncbi:cellulase family glycosylhydrolase [Bacteroidota bacterium]
MKHKIILISFLLGATSLFSQTPTCPFQRGFNLALWFEEESAAQISNYYTKTDFENLVDLGSDHIRLPIHLFNMSGEGPDYTLDPILFLLLDRTVDWAEELGLHLILDNHSFFDPAVETQVIADQLIAVWQQMAEHYKDRSTLIYYEILNEPYGIDDTVWNAMQQQTIDAIRAIDPVHTIIVGPANMYSYNNLSLMLEYDDDNLIYTFHFYDPFLFTHQGSSWTDPPMTDIANIPYPYDESRMPDMPQSLVGTWLADLYDWYDDDGTKASNQAKANVAVQFREERQVPIYCGEFGALQTGSTTEDRTRWTTDIWDIFESNDISWSMWGYKGSFGIFKPGSNSAFPTDLDIPIVEALDLTVPSTPAEILPDTTGMVIYDDVVNPYLYDANWSGDNIINYYAENPKEGVYCIGWSGADRYHAFGWRFSINRDFSQLLADNYSISFWMKAGAPDLRLDLRFLDSDLNDGEDHPWRMTKTIDKDIARLDGTWEKVEIPLKDMVETGSWHNNTWYNPEGKFDWTRIDILQFVAEHHDLHGIQIYLDDIKILKVVNPTITLLIPNGGEEWLAGSQQTISWTSQDIENVKIEYSLNNGSAWNLITASIPAQDESFMWQVPSMSSENCLIKINNAADSNLYDVSDSKFSIKDPSLTLLTPNGGEEWLAGSQQTISWTSQDIENVKIEYSLNNGSDWNLIVESIPAQDKNYNWQVPNMSSENCLIKISNAADNNLYDVSDSKFSIRDPSLTLLTPNGGEEWLAGSQQAITWTSRDVDKIKIDYSINNGSDWQTIISDETAADSHYEWTIPNTVSGNCIVKIMSESDNSILDESDGVFSIISTTNINMENTIPDEYELFINYPNPFNSSTIIKFGIPESGYVKIYIFNSIGQIVAKWIDSYFQAGYHEVIFQSTFLKNELTSGIYYYKIDARDFTSVKKMIMIK